MSTTNPTQSIATKSFSQSLGQVSKTLDDSQDPFKFFIPAENQESRFGTHADVLNHRDIRRRTQLAYQDKYNVFIPEGHTVPISIDDLPYVKDPNNFPNEITNPREYMEAFTKVDAQALVPAAAKSAVFNVWERTGYGMLGLLLTVGCFKSYYFSLAMRYSTWVPERLAHIDTYSRGFVFFGLYMDFTTRTQNLDHDKKYMYAMRVLQREYYENKWGIHPELKERMENDRFWKYVEKRRADEAERLMALQETENAAPTPELEAV